MSALPNYLEGPTYLAISRYPDGETWINETKLNATLQDAVEEIDNVSQVLMLEAGRYVDVSVEAAELWWAKNAHDCDSMFDVPQFIHDHIHNQVYAEISASRYSATCQRVHEGRA